MPANGPSAKRRRLEQVGSVPVTFKIPNNNSDRPAANPPLFRAHALRLEQRRSLGWMLSQEARQPGPDDRNAVRGGLLADRMGYGKTSTAIGLISLDVNKPLRQPGERDVPLLCRDGPGRYIPSDTTLIVCPSHLVDQWEGEFWKFLGKDGVQLWKVQVMCSRPLLPLSTATAIRSMPTAVGWPVANCCHHRWGTTKRPGGVQGCLEGHRRCQWDLPGSGWEGGIGSRWVPPPHPPRSPGPYPKSCAQQRVTPPPPTPPLYCHLKAERANSQTKCAPRGVGSPFFSVAHRPARLRGGGAAATDLHLHDGPPQAHVQSLSRATAQCAGDGVQPSPPPTGLAPVVQVYHPGRVLLLGESGTVVWRSATSACHVSSLSVRAQTPRLSIRLGRLESPNSVIVWRLGHPISPSILLCHVPSPNA